MDNKIICIFCGNMAEIVNRSGSDMVICYYCGRETEFVLYRKNLDKWLDEVQKEP
ncbi:MAG: hypothetical protein KKE59_02315 [Proteobacteria bacterium]|nr:hypothetical protein [Pseudomonadota bacterium]